MALVERSVTVVIAWIGLLVCAGDAAAVLLPEAEPARLPLCLAFACLGPGCAVVAHARTDDPPAAWALVLGLSLAVVALVSAAMAWTGWWRPVAGSVVLSGLCAVSCLAALRRGPAR